MTAEGSGFIELDRAVASIRVGHRHRKDLGDLTHLTDSIRQLGMLQPITISPDGTLICGARRLAVAKHLRLRHVNVWVRAGVSDPLQHLLAEQHENTLRKPYSPREAASLYRELKALLAEDNRRRQHASRYGSDAAEPDGAANLAAPSERTSRAHAAQLVTGRKAYTTLERIGELETLATDPTTPTSLRDLATSQLQAIETDGKVNGRYQRVQAARTCAPATSPATTPSPPAGAKEDPSPARPRRRGVRAFLLTWESMHAWAEDYDPAVIGPALTPDQWAAFTDTVQTTVDFAHAAARARPAS